VNPKKTPKLVFSLLAASLALAGCNRDESVSSYSVKPKSSERTAPSVAERTGEQAAPAQASGDLVWTVPAGWTPLPPAEMRFAGYAVSAEDPNAMLTVAKLGPQPLLANINRWEGQLSLPPTPEAELSKVVTETQIAGFPAHKVDLSGKAGEPAKPLRMIALLVDTGSNTWSIKMMGSPSALEGQKANLSAFLASMKMEEGEAADAGAPESHLPGAMPLRPAVAAANGMEITNYQLPQGWAKDTTPNAFRFLSFKAGPGGQGDVSVSKLPAKGFDISMNVDRWLGQAKAERAGMKPAKYQVGNQDVEGLDIMGAGASPMRLLIAIVPVGEDFWFIRILGPASLVADQKPAFEQFLKSIQFGPSTK
jgi:hypothetical protein